MSEGAAAAAAPAPAAAPASQPAAQPAPAASAPTPAPATQAAAEPVYDLKAPEGFDAAVVPKLVERAKRYGIAPEKAQQLLNDTHAAQVKAKADMEATLAKQKAEWHEAIKADKDYGGDKFEASLQRAQKVVGEIDAKIAPGIKQILGDTGYGDHPAVVRLFNYLGQINREDTFAAGGNSAAAPADLGTRLFGPNPFKGA